MSDPKADVNPHVEEFDTAQPHAFWSELRARCPVAAADDNVPGKRPVYYVSTWSAVNTVLRDPETFSSSINAEGTAQFMGPVLLAMDGDKHRSRRTLISHAFRPLQLLKWEQTLITPTITQLCDKVLHQGRAELVEEVVSKFPVLVICGMCGIPAQDSPIFLRWAKEIHRGMKDAPVGKAASEAMRTYLEPIVEARRLRPGDDLISDIVHAEVEGHKLDDEEIYGFLRLLLPAGSESTYRATCNAVLAILTTPGLYDRVNNNRALLPTIIEETIRWDVSNSQVSRVTTRDTEVEGCPIPAGASLRVITNSANRDETRFVDASTFNPDRPPQRHIGFGLGPHLCLGQPLARLEIKIALDVMLSKFRNLRLDPAYPVPVVQGASFRGPGVLNVLFDAV